jgi:WD40 repeat protein
VANSDDWTLRLIVNYEETIKVNTGYPIAPLYDLNRGHFIRYSCINVRVFDYKLNSLVTLDHNLIIRFHHVLNGNTVLTCQRGYFLLWDGDYKQINKLKIHPIILTSLLLTKDILITNYTIGKLLIRNVTEGLTSTEVTLHDSHVNIIQKVKNDIFITGSRDHTLKIWSYCSGPKITPIRVLKDHTEIVFYIDIIGRYIITSSNDNTTRLWK